MDAKERTLIVVAAAIEARAVLRVFGSDAGGDPECWRVVGLTRGVSLVQTGIGKSNAAGAVARALERGRYQRVVNIGIGGALPSSGLPLGSIVVASRSVFADEGLESLEGFRTCRELGFPIGPCGDVVEGERGVVAALAARLGARAGVIATVSTCSGTDALARRVEERTAAIVEAMEGAAVGIGVARWNALNPRRAARFVEVRVVSNTTGDRSKQVWEMKGALAGVGRVAGVVGGEG